MLEPSSDHDARTTIPTPPKDEETEKYWKQTAFRVVQTYLERKEELVWLRGMIAFLRNKKGAVFTYRLSGA